MMEWLWSPEKFLPESKFWRVAIPTAIGTGLGSWFFWSSLISAGRYVWALIWWQVAIPLWLLSILGFSALAWIGFFAYEYQSRREKEPHEKEFTDAVIDGIHWDLVWENGELEVLRPLCSECGMEMDFEDHYLREQYHTAASCPKGCETGYVWSDSRKGKVIDIIEREIERRVREGEWQSDGETPSFQLFSS